MPSNSDAGLVTGEYFLDHQLVTYQSQGQDIGIDLQYSSAQADPLRSSSTSSPRRSAGNSRVDHLDHRRRSAWPACVQGDATTYNTPGGLTDGETYDIPLQVDASVAVDRRLSLHDDRDRELRHRVQDRTR